MKELNYVNAFYEHTSHQIKFISSVESFDFVLYDMMGRIVFKKDMAGKEIPLPAGLSGVFVWSVLSEGHQYSNRISITN